MLNYFIQNKNGEEKQISSEEYVYYLQDDAECYGETKSVAMETIRENRQEAREDGESEFTLFGGSIAIIRNVIKHK